MLPVLALIGRPNVGKSTLFNYLTRSRDALVADFPGLTRDRQYGFGKRGDRPFLVVDTGGITGDAEGMDGLIAEQARRALEEADAVWLLVDGRDGLNAADEAIALELRRQGRNVVVCVNKTEGMHAAVTAAEFHTLGLGEPKAISALRGDGLARLLEESLPQAARSEREDDDLAAAADSDDDIKVAVIGRPNAGKSTLINRMLGEDRVVASAVAGTTRDSIFVPFERDGQRYTLIDTAGVRRRSRINEAIEKFSVAKTLKAIDAANVVIAVLDAHEEIAEQDARLIGLVVERGRALVIGVNKWDGLDESERDHIRRRLEVKLPFIGFARLHFISALHGTNVGHLYESIRAAHKAAMADLPTPLLTRTLETALEAHPPPASRGAGTKLRYAHQGGQNPPVIVIHGSRTSKLDQSYRRYLINYFRDTLNLLGTPLRIELRDGDNPYAGRRNKLTPRQEHSRKRLMKHVKK